MVTIVVGYNRIMLLLNTQMENTPVMSLQTGSSLGTASNPIIDPRKLKVVAYYVTGPRIQETSVLHTSDVRELGPLGFIVDGVESVMPLDEDLVRLQEVIDLHFSLIGKQVIDEQKKKLGKVIEYTLESDSFLIQKIHVSQSVIKNLKISNLLIHRSQIVELNDRYVMVRSGAVQEPLGLAQVLNPFRKPQTSPLAPEPAKRQPR